MRVPPRWHALIQRCLDQETGPVSRFLQLATLTVDGHPAVRTVVFRDWHMPHAGRDVALTAVTDTRSEKVSQLAAHPYAEICWYFQEARLQFRITGDVTVVNHGEPDAAMSLVRTDVWQRLSTSAKNQFQFPPPGQPRPRDDVQLDDQLFHPPPPDESTPPDTFTVLILHPAKVDVVSLRDNERILFSKQLDGTWQESQVNP